MAGRRRIYPIAALFQFVTCVDEESHIATIVHYQLGTLTVRMRNRPVRTPPIFFQGLSLPREDGNTRFGYRRRGMVLGGKSVATCPAERRTKVNQGLHQAGVLSLHVH